MSQAKKIIAITGVASGLGNAMVEFFTRHGHTVVGCGKVSEKAQLDKLNTEHETTGHFSVADVTSDEEVKQWAAEATVKFGAPDFLINNAAVIHTPSNLWDVSPQDIDTLLDVNVKGTVNTIRHFVPKMIEAEKGIIVNFSSGWGRSPAPQVAPYCATKWAIEGLSKALAMELPSPLACVPFHPGDIVHTALTEKAFGKITAGFFNTAEEWAKVACPTILQINRKMNGDSLSASKHD